MLYNQVGTYSLNITLSRIWCQDLKLPAHGQESWSAWNKKLEFKKLILETHLVGENLNALAAAA